MKASFGFPASFSAAATNSQAFHEGIIWLSSILFRSRHELGREVIVDLWRAHGWGWRRRRRWLWWRTRCFGIAPGHVVSERLAFPDARVCLLRIIFVELRGVRVVRVCIHQGVSVPHLICCHGNPGAHHEGCWLRCKKIVRKLGESQICICLRLCV